MPGVREALEVGLAPSPAAEPARREGIGHEIGGRQIPAGARPAVRVVAGDARRELRRLGAVEEHIRGQALLQSPGSALEREHGQNDRQQCRDERRPVYTRLNHLDATYNSEG
jgi:hypothetical protein